MSTESDPFRPGILYDFTDEDYIRECTVCGETVHTDNLDEHDQYHLDRGDHPHQ